MPTLKRCRWLRAGGRISFFVGVVQGDSSCVFLSTCRLVVSSCSAFDFTNGERCDCRPSAPAVAHSLSTPVRTEQEHDMFSCVAKAQCSAVSFPFSPDERTAFLQSQTGEEHFESCPSSNKNERSFFSCSHIKDEQDEPSPSKIVRDRCAFRPFGDADNLL